MTSVRFPILPLATTPHAALAAGAAHAPYLARLDRQFGGELATSEANDVFLAAVRNIETLCETADRAEVIVALREERKRAHAAIAALDLSGRDSPGQTTQRMTRLADVCVAKALDWALAARGLSRTGLFLVALGKMGAGELNYSSDIDLAAFFDPDLFDSGNRDPADAASRVVQAAMRLLDEQTENGFVFRTDLRLRPDPSSTPVAVSVRRALIYYETVGQNWERMVWIKARPVAGDLEAAEAFIDRITPFVWRPHLDYWAIADVHAIKNMINTKANAASLTASANVKLGPGGIREIEFFAQTQQIILGGRIASLRAPGTLQALKKLSEQGVVDQDTYRDLAEAYPFLRGVEHRIQMLSDQQDHSLPAGGRDREAVAALCGYPDLHAFEHCLNEVRQRVHTHYSQLFATETRKRQSAIEGNLVFTGVDPDPGTIETLAALGFEAPEAVIEAVGRWHRGRIPATRTERGRELLTALLPDALSAMSVTGEADIAFRRFSQFLEGLSSGVQTLSMLTAEHRLLSDLIATLALAPQLGRTLAKRPSLLESLVSEDVRKAAPEIDPQADFETAIDLFRRWHAEAFFLIGHRLLHGDLRASDAARAFSDLADTSLQAMAAVAEAETVRRFGSPPGRWCVAAMGKFGGREMTAASDLDMQLIFDRDGHDEAQAWFTRITQRLITALSADTAEGHMYEVDMRLRPSGRAGPVATSVEAFESYHREAAWTWELMALTRLRPMAGDRELCARVTQIAHAAMLSAQKRPELDSDILDMRRRLWREKPPAGPWDLKLRDGGIVDLEFVVQRALLKAGRADVFQTSLSRAIPSLDRLGVLNTGDADVLLKGHKFLQALQQVQRLAVGDGKAEGPVSKGLRNRMMRAVSAQTFADVEAQLEEHCGRIADLRRREIGSLATES